MDFLTCPHPLTPRSPSAQTSSFQKAPGRASLVETQGLGLEEVHGRSDILQYVF